MTNLIMTFVQEPFRHLFTGKVLEHFWQEWFPNLDLYNRFDRQIYMEQKLQRLIPEVIS